MVDEQKTNTPTEAETTASNSKKGDVIPTASLIERADALRKGLEETEARIKGHIDRFESIAARTILSGRAEAGQISKTPEQITKEEVDRQAAEIIKRFR